MRAEETIINYKSITIDINLYVSSYILVPGTWSIININTIAFIYKVLYFIKLISNRSQSPFQSNPNPIVGGKVPSWSWSDSDAKWHFVSAKCRIEYWIENIVMRVESLAQYIQIQSKMNDEVYMKGFNWVFLCEKSQIFPHWLLKFPGNIDIYHSQNTIYVLVKSISLLLESSC